MILVTQQSNRKIAQKTEQFCIMKNWKMFSRIFFVEYSLRFTSPSGRILLYSVQKRYEIAIWKIFSRIFLVENTAAPRRAFNFYCTLHKKVQQVYIWHILYMISTIEISLLSYYRYRNSKKSDSSITSFGAHNLSTNTIQSDFIDRHVRPQQKR